VGNDPTVGRSGLGGLPGPDRSFRNGRSILIRANTRVGKGALLRAVPTRGHVAGASAGSFAHPTILFEWNAL
jgi:hypothetical protein